jgi:hypothetical protein
MFRLYIEYARLTSPDRDNGKMVGVQSATFCRRLTSASRCRTSSCLIGLIHYREQEAALWSL